MQIRTVAQAALAVVLFGAGPWILLGCSDDAVGCADFTSELTLPVASGNCYKIRIGGFNPNDFGTGTVTITCGQ